ncbi:MAG: carboxyl transferase domain-containing protein, partial [Planctomycetota bacterium]
MTRVETRTWTDVRPNRRAAIPEGLWLRCPACAQMVYRRQMEQNLSVCPECEHHFRVGATERIAQLSDPNSFDELFAGIQSEDPLEFVDLKAYPDRVRSEQKKSGRLDAVLAGEAFIKGRQAVVCCLDLSFMMGSMGSVVGEVVTRSIEHAMGRGLPLIVVSGSGGARMQE